MCLQTFGEIASDTYMMFFFILDQFYYSIHGVSPHFKSLYMNSKDHSCDYIEVTTALYKGQVLLPGSACKHYKSKLPSAAPEISPDSARAELSCPDTIPPHRIQPGR